MYGKFLVVLMLAFCFTEVMDNSIAPLTFQVNDSRWLAKKKTFVTLETVKKFGDGRVCLTKRVALFV